MAKPSLESVFSNCVSIPFSGCLIWLGAGNQYGIIREKKKNKLVHRFVYEQMIGPIPAGKEVCHRCDIGVCVNPNHLFLGNHQENMRDMAKKGRARGKIMRGLDHPNTKLSIRDYVEIMKLRAENMNLQSIGKRFNVHRKTIAKAIIDNHAWAASWPK